MGGPVTRVSMNIDAWDYPHFRRMSVAGRVVRVGWFHEIDPLIVTLGRGTFDRISIAVPPRPSAVRRGPMTDATDRSRDER
jgi:hypothetical protein